MAVQDCKDIKLLPKKADRELNDARLHAQIVRIRTNENIRCTEMERLELTIN